jgi:hypothetical protein
VTVKCRTCGATHEMGYCSPVEFAFCDSKCEKHFNHVVDMLSTGAPLDMIGAKPGSQLWAEAEKEIARREARFCWQARESLVQDYLETLPRQRASVAKRYFS